MGLTRNLQYEAELFAASSRLQSVATGLNAIIVGQQIDVGEQEHFEWAGSLMGQMDWHSDHYHQKEHPELGVIATRLRPNFYGTLCRLRIPFNTTFSEGLYETLKSRGEKVKLGTEELIQAHQVVQSLATDTLTKLRYAHGRAQFIL
ncbi:MAG: hypothetical protein J4469_05130 [Candidatus Aenigmarchaeota archaeon]|nr:hypothetical protein [Candidatus Aenigmarchaeota archaeon]MBS3120992.1 hypothetical protein [Candidatus Woesearchaeota archaeon]HIH13294.1 hypothetical protein [Candidatus Woesearchaeota archaeon]HLC71848.1 hypothetical protein [Candidatus Nanoarchaeia archaeon]